MSLNNLKKIWVTPEQWANGELMVENEKIYLPPTTEDAQAQLRSKRKLTYTKSAGRVFYILDDIFNYFEKNKVVASR